MNKIKFPLSVIDGRKVSLQDTFSWILNYYNPNKKFEGLKARVLDTTCGMMLMWNKDDFDKFIVETNDIRNEIPADYHLDCKMLLDVLEPHSFDILIYDPPYIDLKNRKDKKKYEIAFNYEAMKTIEDLKKLTTESSPVFKTLLRRDGILILKITNFHNKTKKVERIRGSYDMRDWFSSDFYHYDEVIFRFFKPIPNLNFYNKKVAKTHSYFLIFKLKE